MINPARPLACFVSAIALCIAPLFLLAQAPSDSGLTAIRAGKLFDAKAGKMVENQVILVHGEQIQQVGSNLPIPSGAKVIDLSKATVMPGFIDVHTHLNMNAGHGGPQGLTISVPRMALIGAKNARITLMAGFTTVRNLGAEGFSDVALRDAINDGDVIGPRMQVSGPMISITGGHGDDSILPFEFHATGDGVADGPDELRHKVRENIKYGADVIKFAASGGTMSKGDNPLLEAYSPEEMQILISEAHRQGRKVATHAHSALAIKDAVRAGVDSVEHGIFLDDEGIAPVRARSLRPRTLLDRVVHERRTGISAHEVEVAFGEVDADGCDGERRLPLEQWREDPSGPDRLVVGVKPAELRRSSWRRGRPLEARERADVDGAPEGVTSDTVVAAKRLIRAGVTRATLSACVERSAGGGSVLRRSDLHCERRRGHDAPVDRCDRALPGVGPARGEGAGGGHRSKLAAVECPRGRHGCSPIGDRGEGERRG